MKFQSYRLKFGQWRDLDSGKMLEGVTGLIADRVIESHSVEAAMRELRSGLNPSPIVSVIDMDARPIQ